VVILTTVVNGGDHFLSPFTNEYVYVYVIHIMVCILIYIDICYCLHFIMNIYSRCCKTVINNLSLPPFLPFLPSFITSSPSLFPSFLISFLPSFLPFFFPSFLLSFFPSVLIPYFLPSFPSPFLPPFVLSPGCKTAINHSPLPPFPSLQDIPRADKRPPSAWSRNV
jgi:hypothetical protein